MRNQVGRREVGRGLVQCAARCELALQEYVSRLGVPVEHELVRALIPAIATLRTAADVLDEQLKGELALRLAYEACSRAAIECRRYGLDEPLLRCAAACDQAVAGIELLLTAPLHD
jgi:hypothetical protein